MRKHPEFTDTWYYFSVMMGKFAKDGDFSDYSDIADQLKT